MKLVIAFFFFSAFVISCKDKSTSKKPTEISIPKLTQQIETAHKKDLFLSKSVISYKLNVKFGGQDYLNAKITQTVNGDKIKMEKASGEILLFDGKNVYTNLKDSDLKSARFDIFTWPYFFNLPYKLNDTGTVWTQFEDKIFNGKNVSTGKLSFKANTGDAPDDWYVIYKDPVKNYLVGVAYIVTFGEKNKAEAEKHPSGLKYIDFKEIDGIPMATKLFWCGWDSKNGFLKDIHGEGTVSEIGFSNFDEKIFQKTSNSIVVPLKN